MKNQPNIFIVLILSAGVIYACQNNGHHASADSTDTTVASSHHDSTHGNLAGSPVIEDSVKTYSGVLPCADCESIETTLTLKNDFTYQEHLLYYGRKSKGPGSNEVSLQGNWMKHGTTIHLVGKEGGATYYLQTDSSLIQVDENGQRIGGQLADKFVLKKL